jgi:predicted GIY-YIG superfamily endonuclease
MELFGPTGMSLFLRLCPYGSDTIAIDNVALTEATNRKTLYTGIVSNLSGRHTAHVRNSDGVYFLSGDVWMNPSGICRVHDAADFIQDLLEADQYIDTAATPWKLVLVKKGSGSLSTGQRLLTQNLKTVDGTNLSSIDTFVGQTVAP